MRNTSALLLSFVSISVLASEWPQWLGPQRDGIWREDGIIEKFDGAPKLKWKVDVGGGYSGPAVADGRVFLTDRQLAKGVTNPANKFTRGRLAGSERILCLRESDGKLLWKHEYDCPYQLSYPAGPRCTPTVDGERVYVLGAMGDLFCLAVADGKVIWQRNFEKEFGAKVPVWGFAAHPLVDGKKLIALAAERKGRLLLLTNLRARCCGEHYRGRIWAIARR